MDLDSLGWQAVPRIATLVLALAFTVPAHGAEETAQAVERLASGLTDVSFDVGRLQEDLTIRRGLMGAGEARARFEESVYNYLVGDYTDAAAGFLTLVQSGALTGAGLDTDSEWYLGECLFEMGSYQFADEAYGVIVDKGSSHPFFVDAVRRQLELYGLTGQTERFNSLYNTYIVTGRVQPTDLIRYSLAKSFYWQGETARAKSLFMEISPDGPWYARARYFLGTILVVDESYGDAILQFDQASAISVLTDDDRQVQDLANLALGRLYYETGDMGSSSLYYQRIGRSSPYFAEALYEIVWTYVKQEEYRNALDAVEIFLLDFSKHRSAAQLRLTRGHLHMKLLEYDEALISFEEVVADYEPVQESVQRISRDPMGPMDWFARLSDIEAVDFRGAGGLPLFAVEQLMSNSDFERALVAWQELGDQREDIETSEALIDEIEAALAEGGGSLGLFQRARVDLDRILNDLIRIQDDVLEAEEAWLLGSVPDTMRVEVRALQQRRLELAGSAATLRESVSSGSDREQVYEDQIRSVQSQASRTQQVAGDLIGQAEALQRFIDAGSSKLGEGELEDVKLRLAAVRKDLNDQSSSLGTLQGDSTRRAVMSAIETVSDASEDRAARRSLARSFHALRKQYDPYVNRSTAEDRAEVQAALNRTWEEVDDVERKLAGIIGELDRVEAETLSSVRSQLSTETSEVSTARSNLTSQSVEAERLAADITRVGFNELEEHLGTQVLRADVGIVDVYWTQKTRVSDERDELIKQREVELRELNSRFRVIRQALPEPVATSDAQGDE